MPRVKSVIYNLLENLVDVTTTMLSSYTGVILTVSVALPAI